jgi:two-component system, NarL family, response regulator
MERALLQLLVNGQSDLKIALAMSMGERTVRKYLGCIYDKLGVTGRVQAAVKAVRMGLAE